MKLAALCCTFHRPHLLGQLVESFLRQDYPRHLRELVILDDAGQYENQAGEGWRLISVPARFRTLGEKRNACAALASPDAEGFLVADDDDVYLPHWFSTQAEALKKADWSRPSLVLLAHGDGLKEHDTGGLYHGGWAFRREAFDWVRGYAALNNGEDQDLARRLTESKATVCDPCEFARPFYHYRVDTGSYHLSYLDDAGYRDLGRKTTKGKHKLQPGWPKDFTRLPVVRRFTAAPHVSHRDGLMPVELIGPVHAPGCDGPTNGMYALQKELRKRIADGLDWLSIKSLPASDGALPWFWHWDDRRYAVWWDSEGRPFVQGPNMLFTYSGKPRIDAEEHGLLDAANCRAMFCHSDWYRDLIATNRGPANTAPIVTWPYPTTRGPANRCRTSTTCSSTPRTGTGLACSNTCARSSPATSCCTTASTSGSSCSRRPGGRGPAPTWPTTTTARSRCKRFCWPAARWSASAPVHRSSRTVSQACSSTACRPGRSA
jgi:glycosyltransferase involved in cell wall biosynthesis